MRRETWDLLNAGDWACAHGDAEALGRVARELAPRLRRSGLARDADRIANIAVRDLGGASRQWSQLAGRLRADAAPVAGRWAGS